VKTKPKNLGTQLETWTVRKAQTHNLTAERLPEGGTNDRGDIRIQTNIEWIGECKNRTNLNIHQELTKAIKKAGHPHTFIVWKRLTRKPGNTNRTQPGPPIIALTVETFLQLLKETTTQ